MTSLKLIFSFILVCSSCEKKDADFSKEKYSELSKTDSLNSSTLLKNKRYIWVKKLRYDLKKIDFYEPLIRRYAKLNSLDWRLITAMILKESSFNEKAISRVGAKGLMQIMPLTKEELSKRLDIEYIYERPKENLKAGIFHLSEQFNFFPTIKDSLLLMKIVLASYNCGAGRLLDAIQISQYKFGLALSWERISWALSHLKKRDYKLHLNIWAEGKPKRGYFNNPIETVSYVNRIWKIYTILQTKLKL